MLKHFLATTALATLLASGLHAQTEPAADPAEDPAAPVVEGEDGAMDAPATDAPPEVVEDDPIEPDASTTPEVAEDDPMAPDAEAAPDVAQDDPMAPDSTTTPEVAEDAPMDDAADPMVTEDAEPMDDAADPMVTEDAAPTDDAADTMAADGDWAPLDVSTMSTDQLIGADIVTHENETIASIEDVLITDDGQVESLVARFGGFLGFGADRVLLTVDEIEVMQDESETLMVRTSLTPESIEGRPVYEEDAETVVE